MDSIASKAQDNIKSTEEWVSNFASTNKSPTMDCLIEAINVAMDTTRTSIKIMCELEKKYASLKAGGASETLQLQDEDDLDVEAFERYKKSMMEERQSIEQQTQEVTRQQQVIYQELEEIRAIYKAKMNKKIPKSPLPTSSPPRTPKEKRKASNSILASPPPESKRRFQTPTTV